MSSPKKRGVNPHKNVLKFKMNLMKMKPSPIGLALMSEKGNEKNSQVHNELNEDEIFTPPCKASVEVERKRARDSRVGP